MHIHPADQYQQGSSYIYRLDPRTKIIAVVLFILSVSLAPSGAWLTYLLLYTFLSAVAFASGLGIWRLVRRSYIALPFALAAVTLLFTVPGEALVSLPILGDLTISQEGAARFFSIIIKSWISVQAALLLVAIAPFPDILWALRALWVPQRLVAVIGFSYRYLFVISDEALRLMRARSARSANIRKDRGGGNILWRGKIAGRMVGTLMLRSIERSERIYQAMLSRGYSGQFLTMSNPKMSRQDYLVLLSVTALLIVLLSTSQLFSGLR